MRIPHGGEKKKTSDFEEFVTPPGAISTFFGGITHMDRNNHWQRSRNMVWKRKKASHTPSHAGGQGGRCTKKGSVRFGEKREKISHHNSHAPQIASH